MKWFNLGFWDDRPSINTTLLSKYYFYLLHLCHRASVQFFTRPLDNCPLGKWPPLSQWGKRSYIWGRYLLRNPMLVIFICNLPTHELLPCLRIELFLDKRLYQPVMFICTLVLDKNSLVKSVLFPLKWSSVVWILSSTDAIQIIIPVYSKQISNLSLMANLIIKVTIGQS